VSVKRITRMGRHLRRAERAKRGRPRRSERRKQRATAFGYQLAMLAAGAPLVDVIASACGASDAGRMHAERWRVLLAEIPQKAHRRRVFEHYLRTFNGARLHGSQWRVVDAEGYVGQRYAMGWREDVDDSTGEVTLATDENPDAYDLLSRIGMLVLAGGGEVIAVRRDEVSAGIWNGAAVAHLRYPLAH